MDHSCIKTVGRSFFSEDRHNRYINTFFYLASVYKYKCVYYGYLVMRCEVSA